MITGDRRLLIFRLAERGYTLDEVRACVVSEDGHQITVDETHPAYPRERKANMPPRQAPALCGSELKRILATWLGVAADADCGCTDMALQMDARGPDWCEGEGLPVIVEHMKSEHAKRWQSGKTWLPWIDVAARRLVLLACRRARAAALTEAVARSH